MFPEKVQKITPLTAVQNIYSVVERGVEEKVIPYCEKHGIGLVAFSPTSSGLLSGKLKTDMFEKVDDVRRFVPQLTEENMKVNAAFIEKLNAFAAEESCTTAQLSLAWMICKSPIVVPIPGSKNKAHILENLKASEVELSGDRFHALDQLIEGYEVHGHRGFVENDKKRFLPLKK